MSKKHGKFALRRAGGGPILKGEKKDETPKKQSKVRKVKEVKGKDKIPEIKKAIVPVVEEQIEEEIEIKDHGLSEEEIEILGTVESIVDKKETVGKTKGDKGVIVFGKNEDAKNISMKRVDGHQTHEIGKDSIIELTPDTRCGVFEEVVSKIRNWRSEAFVRISNGSIQYQLLGKAIKDVYLKEDKYKLKTVPYMHTVRNEEAFEINLCSEIVTVNKYAYFAVVEISKDREEIQKVILLDTNFILK